MNKLAPLLLAGSLILNAGLAVLLAIGAATQRTAPDATPSAAARPVLAAGPVIDATVWPALSEGDLPSQVARLRESTATPVAVGFGVRDAASAAAIGAFADAVVIGSALVERLAGAATEAELRDRAHAFLAPIRAALDERIV
jgi:tryptophan synthase alpha chain